MNLGLDGVASDSFVPQYISEYLILEVEINEVKARDGSSPVTS